MSATNSEERRITADDLYGFRLVNNPQISPDGAHVIYSVQRVDREQEKKYANLWLVSASGAAPRQFTYGDQTDSQPHWSPDGNYIAFLSNREDEKQPQLYVIPFFGGEARPVTDLKGQIGDFRWSPDGATLLIQFRKKDKEAIEREEDDKKKKLGVVERHIMRSGFRLDGVGYLPQERWHVWTVDVTTGEATQLTEGENDEIQPRWSPDGAHVVFVSNRSEDPDLYPEKADLFVMNAAGGEPRLIETPPGQKLGVSWSPDGRTIAYTGSVGRGNWWQNNGLWIVPADGSAAARNLTAEYDLHVANSTVGDVADRPFTTPVWAADGSKLYFQISRHGNTTLHAVSRDGELEDILTPDGVISDFSMSQTRRRIAYIWSHFADPGQIWLYEPDDGEERQLTHANEEWLEEVELGEIEEIWFEGPDGNELQGWILKPPGFDETEQYPSILEVHGGPWLQYGNLFMHEFYFLAAQGYVVTFTNPRGGQGYGESHGKAIHLCWGGADYDDVMAWADYVSEKPYIDTERMGITGGSYGGYMTLWVIGHSDRFKAAVAQRVVSNTISFWGSSDLGYLFENPWGEDRPPWEVLDNYWEQSPMKFIAKATTPTLIIHSEQDMRCNLEQGTQAYLALRRQGVETELVIFPEESHGLSRGGRTDRRVARLNHILRWFDRYLKSES